MSSLPVKYRPKEFNEVSSQTSIIKILEQQLKTKQFKNAYLWSGPSGCGKTTIARIFANKINGGVGSPIEIDAASNGSVDNVRTIIESASQRSLDSEYKIFIIDECHAITSAGWQSLLKTIEETPKYTIFMFCTTEYHKVPATIQNRCQQYFLTRVPDEDIIKRLEYISNQEGFNTTEEGLQHITKLAQGSMRQAIAYLEKCRDYSNDITIENVLSVLGDFSYDTYFNLINAMIDKNQKVIIEVVENLYNKGNDLKLFLDLFIDFILDLTKYAIFRAFDIVKIPQSYKEKLLYTINVEDVTKYFNHVLDKLLETKQLIKGDSNTKTTLEISFSQI